MPRIFPHTDHVYSNYVNRLSSAMRRRNVSDPDFAADLDDEIYEKIRRETVVWSAIEQRRHDVAGQEWHLEPGGDRDVDKLAAAVIEDLLKDVRRFTSSRYHLAEAFLKGSSWSYMCGSRRVRVAGGLAADWCSVSSLAHLPKWRFMLRKADDAPGDAAAEWHLWSVQRHRWEPLRERRRWFIHHVYDDAEESLGYGRGLMESMFYYHVAKTEALSYGLEGLETWARGIITAKIDGGPRASTARTNTDIRDAWIDVLESMRSRHVLAYDSRDEIGVVTTTGTGHQMVVDFLSYLDRSITRLVLGSVLPFGGDSDVGSNSRAETEERTTVTLISYDRQLLDETLTADLVGFLWSANLPQMRAAGLGAAEPPVYKTTPTDTTDVREEAEVAGILLGNGLDLKRSEVYERVGYTPPAEGDDVIEAGAGVPSSPSALGGFGAPPLALGSAPPGPASMTSPPTAAQIPPRFGRTRRVAAAWEAMHRERVDEVAAARVRAALATCDRGRAGKLALLAARVPAVARALAAGDTPPGYTRADVEVALASLGDREVAHG